MPKPHNTHNHEVCQEHLMITALLVELQAIDEKAKLAVRFYEVMEWISQNEIRYQKESINSFDLSK